MASITSTIHFCNKVNSRVSSGYASDTEALEDKNNTISRSTESTELSQISSSDEVTFTSPKDLFYSDIEIDELAQRFESNIHSPGTYFYANPTMTKVEAPEMFYLGTWPYVQTAQSNSRKIESCLFASLNGQRAVLFINMLKASLIQNVAFFGGDPARFEAILTAQFQRNLSELVEPELSNNEMRNFIYDKSIRIAYFFSVPKERQTEAMEAYSRCHCYHFTIAYLGRQSENEENNIVIKILETDKKHFIETNIHALFGGMEILRRKYEPLIEGTRGLFANITKIIETMEKTALAVKVPPQCDILPKKLIKLDEYLEEPSVLSKTAEEHLDLLNGIYDSLLNLLGELNNDLDTFQKQREVMTDVHYANQRYKKNGMASYPYLTCDKTIRIDKANPSNDDFSMFLEDLYDGVDSIYLSHMVYFRKTIIAVENVRETLAGVVDRYQELVAFS